MILKKWIFFVIFLFNAILVMSHNITAPSRYIALTGDVTLQYSLDAPLEMPFIQLVETTQNDSIIISKDLDVSKLKGELTIDCGLVDHAGQYVFHLYDKIGGSIVTSSDIMVVKWPYFTISLPKVSTALTAAVNINYLSNGAKCSSKKPDSVYTANVVYYGMNDTNYFSTRDRSYVTVYTTMIKDIYGDTNGKLQSIPCFIFDQAGIYKVALKSNHDENTVIAWSNQMFVKWSEEYSLNLTREVLTPCKSDLVIHYTQPKCAGNYDKIRIYKLSRPLDSPRAIPTSEDYITEMSALKDRSTVKFSCLLIHQLVPG
ncbi:unnamed protein product, partial [Owenia fusiformis]